MRFWDTSALVPLVIDEETTESVRHLLRRDPDVVIWILTSVELLSAVGRLGRQSNGLSDLLPTMRAEALRLVDGSATITDIEAVRHRAERLVGVHALAAADALQLAAALVAASDRPERLEFVTLDTQLGRSAQLEGFRVISVLPKPQSTPRPD